MAGSDLASPGEDPALPARRARSATRGFRFASALGIEDAGRALRDFATYLPTKLIPAIAGLLVLPLLARRLAPNELGVLAIAQTLIALGWIVAGQWLTSAINRQLPAHLASGEVPLFTRRLLRGMHVTAALYVAFVAVLGVGSTLSSAVSDNFWLIVAASAGLIAQNVAVTLFAASLRPLAYAAVEILARTGGLVLGLILVFHGHKVTGFLAGVAIASCAVGGLGLLVAWPSRPQRSREPVEVRSWMQYGVPVSATAFALWGLLFVDRYLIQVLKSASSVGLYTVGSAIGERAVMIPAFAFYTAARPLLVTAFERKGREEVERLMGAYTRIVLLVSVPVVAFVSVARHQLVSVLVGQTAERLYYRPTATVIPFIAAGTMIYVLTLIGNTGLTIARRSVPLLYAALVGLGVNVASNLILIPELGIKGAAISTPIAMAAYLVACVWWSRPYASWRFPWATLVRVAVAAGAGSGAALAGMRLSSSQLGKLGLAAALGAAGYLAVLALLGEARRHRSSAA